MPAPAARERRPSCSRPEKLPATERRRVASSRARVHLALRAAEIRIDCALTGYLLGGSASSPTESVLPVLGPAIIGNAVLGHFVVHHPARDPQELGGLLLDPVAALQGFQERLL